MHVCYSNSAASLGSVIMLAAGPSSDLFGEVGVDASHVGRVQGRKVNVTSTNVCEATAIECRRDLLWSVGRGVEVPTGTRQDPGGSTAVRDRLLLTNC